MGLTNSETLISRADEVSEKWHSLSVMALADISGPAANYVPWTLKDPYYSHFLYKSDDYSK